MRVLALVEGVDHVCSRYRIEAFASALVQEGSYLTVEPLAASTWGRLRQFQSAGRAELVILQRKLLPLWQLCMLRRSARRLVFDFDDALWQRDSFSPRGQASNRRLVRFWATLQAADAVFAGNAHLRDRAAAYVEVERVHLVPTCVEPERYEPARSVRRGAEARLTWIGSASMLASLDRARAELAEVAARLPGVELHLICDRAIDLPGMRVELHPWSSASEAADLARADIGLSWLVDDAWSSGKCGLKTLQYMAAGLPVVGNPVGMNLQLIQPGRTGLLASTPQEWAEAIARLADDPALRRRMGQAGRERVEAEFNVAAWGPRWARLLAHVARADRRPLAAPSSLPDDSSETPGRFVA